MEDKLVVVSSEERWGGTIWGYRRGTYKLLV